MRSLFFISALCAQLTAAVVCYRNDGTPMTGEGWDEDYVNNVCNPLAATSHCCSTSDICLSNGLCSNSGGGNGIEIQACTSKNWDSPCQNKCAASNVTMGVFLFSCQQEGFPYPYCCDHASQSAADCCAQGNSFSIEPGKLVLRSFQIADLGLQGASTRSIATVLPTNTGARPASETGAQATPGSTAASTPSGKDTSNGNTIALAVGISLGLAFLTALGLLGWIVLVKRKAGGGSEKAMLEEPTKAVDLHHRDGYGQHGFQHGELPVHPSELPGHGGTHELQAERASRRMQ